MQFWMPVNIDTKEARKGWGGFWDCFYDPPTMHSIVRLFRPFRPFPELAPISRTGNEISRHSNSPLLRLPPELLKEMGRNMLPIPDIICLAAACHHLWDVLSPDVEEWIKKTSWVGCRIVCVDDYSNEIPPSLLSDAEFQKCAERIQQRARLSNSADKPSNLASLPENLYDYFYKYYDEPRGDVRKFLRRVISTRCLEGEPRNAIEYAISGCHDFWFSSPPAVLRNLSKKVYVRSVALSLLSEKLFGDKEYQRGDGYCLGNALYSRICWTEKTPSDPHLLAFTRGAWAGDRFDVIPEEDFEEALDKEEWEDVSEDVCKTLAEVWPDGGIRREVIHGHHRYW